MFICEATGPDGQPLASAEVMLKVASSSDENVIILGGTVQEFRQDERADLWCSYSGAFSAVS